MSWPARLKGVSFGPEIMKRFTSGVFLIGSLLLVVWSITFRLSLVTEAQSQIHTPFSLSRQVTSLEQMWSDEEQNLANYEWDSQKSQSFHDYDHLTTWVTQVTGQAQDLGLSVSYRIDDSSTPVQGVEEIHRIGMNWTIQAENPDRGYRRLMEFLQALSEDELKINFESFELIGSGRGAQKMEFRIHTFLQQTT